MQHHNGYKFRDIPEGIEKNNHKREAWQQMRKTVVPNVTFLSKTIHNYNMRKPLLVTFLFLLFIPSVIAVNQSCITYNTLEVNTTNYITTSTGTEQVDLTSHIYCPYNCSNNACIGSNLSSDMGSIWIVYGTGVIFLVLGTVLGIPFGRITGENKDVKKGFNTTMVVKYMFFFVGLFLVYLSLGMVRRTGMVYGSDTGVSSANDTAVMVMMITIILFLFVFIVEFIFGLLKSMMESAKLKKENEWKEREVEQ